MGAVVVNEKHLTGVESSRLNELEQTIKENFMAFVAVGNALAEINNKRLYRNDEGRTFEGYCAELWDMCRDNAYKLIGAAKVVENLSTIVDKTEDNQLKLLPANEAQARELAKLAPEEQRQAWRQVVENSNGGKITARRVKSEVKEFRGEQLEIQLRKSSNAVRKNSKNKQSDLFAEVWDAFWVQVELERKKNWRHTSRKVVLDNLKKLTTMLSADGKKETQAPGCGMTLSDREKLRKAGFQIFRMNSKDLLIEKWFGVDNWMVTVSCDTPAELRDMFNKLLDEPKNLRA